MKIKSPGKKVGFINIKASCGRESWLECTVVSSRLLATVDTRKGPAILCYLRLHSLHPALLGKTNPYSASPVYPIAFPSSQVLLTMLSHEQVVDLKQSNMTESETIQQAHHSMTGESTKRWS